MNRSTSTTWRYLAPNPQSSYKQLFVNGTSIRARVLYGMFMSAEEPMTPEQIAADFNLPVEAVREAIAYCQGNPPEIAQDLQREERLMQASGSLSCRTTNHSPKQSSFIELPLQDGGR
jgi:uncharacterized protein (DUF433 family)